MLNVAADCNTIYNVCVCVCVQGEVEVAEKKKRKREGERIFRWYFCIHMSDTWNCMNCTEKYYVSKATINSS